MMLNIFKNRIKIESSVLGMNERNVRCIYPNNSRKHFPLADDKILCKEVLHEKNIACAQTYGTITKIGDIHAAWEQVKHHEKMAIKPANGSGGGGILILKKKDCNWFSGDKPMSEEKIFMHFAHIIMGMYSFGSKDSVLIEQCIEPHSFFHEIFPAGVPDFRVILLKDQPIMAMLRLPTAKSDGKANLHQGGLGIGVDMSHGTLTYAYDGENYHESHPDSLQLIKGKIIPYWDELLQLSIQTSLAFPLDYLGVDIVLDQKLGPLIMEINVRPGLGIQLANRKGLKEALETLKTLKIYT